MPTYDPTTPLEGLFRHNLLSKRSYNCLNNAGLVTIEDVIKYVRAGKELMDIPRMGRGCELEIKKLLQNCKVEEAPKLPKANVKDFYHLDPSIREILTKTFENFKSSLKAHTKTASNTDTDANTDILSSSESTPKSNQDYNPESTPKYNPDSNPDYDSNFAYVHQLYPEGVNGFIALKYDNAESFFNAIVSAKEEVFKIQPYLNTSENIAFRMWHIQLLQEVVDSIENAGMREHSQCVQLSYILHDLKYDYKEFSFTDILQNYITEDTDFILQESYDALSRELLSTRALNFRNSAMPSYRTAVEYFGKTFDEYNRLCPGRSMTKTLREIYDFVEAFRAQEFSAYERFLDNGEIILNKVRRDYPFLNIPQCFFVKDFIQQYKIRPMFFLLNRYLRNSTKKECVYFCLYHGLNEHRESHTLEEIAQKRRTSADKAAKAISDRYNILFGFRITHEEFVFYKDLFAKSDTPNLITEGSEIFKAVMSNERLPEGDFGLFSALCTLLQPDYKIFNELGFNALITSYLRSRITDGRLFEKFQKVNSVRYTKETFFSYSYLNRYITKEYYKDVAYLLTLMTKDRPSMNKLTFNDKGVILGEKKLDITQELYKILEEEGGPMTLEQIYERFKDKHPNHKFYNPSQLRPYISRSKDLIKPIGREGRYALAHWEHIYFGTLGDMLFETLQKSSTPMHKDDLLKVVKENFPNSNLKYITHLMQQDHECRFKKFEDGYYGLNGIDYPQK